MDITQYIIKKTPAVIISWVFGKIFGKKNIDIFGKMLGIKKWKKATYRPAEKWIFNLPLKQPKNLSHLRKNGQINFQIRGCLQWRYS